MNPILQWLKTEGGKHVEGIIIAAVLVFGGRMYLQEHDARIKSDAQVSDLEKQKATVQQVAQARVIVLKQEAAATKTPEAATVHLVQEHPELQPSPLPDMPDRISVETVPLYQDLNLAAQDRVNLEACTKTVDIQDAELKAARAKPSFWTRLGKGLKVVGCSAAGGALGGLAGAKGAAVGAATGASVCQMF